jgi:hypothetical protein
MTENILKKITAVRSIKCHRYGKIRRIRIDVPI